jgi:hypothetical protein
MRTVQIEVGGVEYECNTAPAKNQFEALHIAMRTGMVANLQGEPSDMAIVAMMGALSYDDLNRLITLLVKDCAKRSEDNVEVAENLFQDNIQDYYLLVGRLVKENLAPFWKLRRPTAESQGTAEQS